jgi:hypothetical protein
MEQQQEKKVDEISGVPLGHSMYEFAQTIYQACVANGINPIFGVAIAVIGTLSTGFAIGGAIMTALGWGDIVQKVKAMYSDWKARKQVNPDQIKRVGEEFVTKVNSIKDPGRRKYFMGLLNKMKRTDPTDKQAIVNVQKDIVNYAKAYAKDDQALTEELRRLQELAGIAKEDVWQKGSQYEYQPNEGAEVTTEAVEVPENVMRFAKRKGIQDEVMTVARWANRAGKRIVGGTAIGKDYGTLILDLTYNGGEVRYDIDNATMEVNGETVDSYEEFLEALEGPGTN